MVTDDNAYVEYNDQAYEVGTEQFAQLATQFEAQAEAAAGGADAQGTFQEQCATAIEQAGGDPSACDFDPASWLTNETNEGTEDVGGTETVHIAGDADVEQILTDIGNLASSVPGRRRRRASTRRSWARSRARSPMPRSTSTRAPTDHVLRKLEANLTIDPSAVAPEGVAVPIEDIQISFAVEIAGLNEEQTIEAPSDAKPIDELFGDLGLDPSALGGLGGACPAAPAAEWRRRRATRSASSRRPRRRRSTPAPPSSRASDRAIRRRRAPARRRGPSARPRHLGSDR